MCCNTTLKANANGALRAGPCTQQQQLVKRVNMTMIVSAADAKSRLAEHLRSIERGNEIVITRHGKAVAALISAGDLVQLRRLRAARPETGLAGLAGGWEGTEALVKEVARIRRSRPRRVPRPDDGAHTEHRRVVRTRQSRRAR